MKMCCLLSPQEQPIGSPDVPVQPPGRPLEAPHWDLLPPFLLRSMPLRVKHSAISTCLGSIPPSACYLFLSFSCIAIRGKRLHHRFLKCIEIITEKPCCLAHPHNLFPVTTAVCHPSPSPSPQSLPEVMWIL